MRTPFVDPTMPDGSRLHVVIGDMTHAEAADCPIAPNYLPQLR
jgi:hypothetical protein